MPSTTPFRLPRAFARVLAFAGLAAFATVSAPSGAAAQLASPFANMPEVAEYRLTSAALQQFVQATEALKALEEDESFQMRDHLEIEDPSEISVDRIAAAFDSEPRVRGAIEEAGMTSREYVTFMMAMVQTIMGSVVVQMGGEQALNAMPDSVLKHNIQFFLDSQHVFESLDDA
jgi:hypothetical protein